MMKTMKLYTAVIAGLLLAVSSTAAKAEDIVGIAAGNKDFSTLVTAVKAAGLVETLQGEGPFTVFAPTDEAFAKLPAGTVEDLLKPENKDKLVAVLTYHVVAGNKSAAALASAFELVTVQGPIIMISVWPVKDGRVMLNNIATITSADIKASNGVIHVIDAVIVPPSVDLSAL